MNRTTLTTLTLAAALGLTGCGGPVEENVWERTDRLAASATPPPPAPPAQPPQPAPRPTDIAPWEGDLVPVVRVVDGDTVRVHINGEDRSYRVIGIDTPETVKPNTPVQCYGPEATAAAKQLLEGQRVAIVPDPTQGNADGKDRYGRWLGYVVLADGTDYAARMIREGFGREYRYQSDYQRMPQYRAAEEAAKLDNAGLWGAC